MADVAPHRKQLELVYGLMVSEPADFVRIVIEASDQQVGDKIVADEEAREDFVLSTDALNYWRLSWRCSVEWSTHGFGNPLTSEIKAGICKTRGYESDDLESALQATKGRARLPFGWNALDFAWRLSQQEPIRLLVPSLEGRRVPTAIAGIAYHLQILQDKDPILLPIDQLRALLKQRKIVVSGAVQRLVEAGILDFADKNYHTGKAREFRFVGIGSEHFERITKES